MMMGDFATLVQHKLPVKVVLIKNNTLGLVKWEQMLYLGNPEYGVDLAPIDFVKFAEACGSRGLRIEDPRRCREQLREGLAIDGPALIECVVDPLEPPWPPEISRDEAEKLGAAIRRGERSTRPIGLTIGRHAVQEFSFGQSPFGIAGRVLDRLTGRRDDKDKRGADKDRPDRDKMDKEGAK
ncbi:MAG: thiamine pyrophosphate-dependent enzyme, partial [Stellaceae bacterium]